MMEVGDAAGDDVEKAVVPCLVCCYEKGNGYTKSDVDSQGEFLTTMKMMMHHSPAQGTRNISHEWHAYPCCGTDEL